MNLRTIAALILSAMVASCSTWAGAATLLPNGEQCFVTSTGAANAAGQVFMYVPSTTTPKQTWKDAAQTQLNTTPIILDSAGCAVIYGVGSYRQLVMDSTGTVTYYDQVTTDTSASNSVFWAGLAGGTANAITVTDASFNSTDGSIINFTAAATNTSAVTITPSGTGVPVPVLKDTTAGPVALTGGEIVVGNPISVIFRTSDGSFHLLNPPIQSASGSKAPLCGAVGLRIVNNVANPNTQLDIAADNVVMLSATGDVINRSNVSVTVNLSTNGANGLDTGSVAVATIYNIYLIDNGAAAASLASTSATSPTLPSGYSYKCRMSALITDGSAHLYQVIVLGAETHLTTTAASAFNVVTGTCFSTFSPITFSVVPPTATIAIGKLSILGSQNAAVARVSGVSETISGVAGGGAAITVVQYFRAPFATPQVLYYCSDSVSNQLAVYGWVDKVNAH